MTTARREESHLSTEEEDNAELIIPEPGTPAYWDVAYTHAEVYADGHIDVNLEAIRHAVGNMGNLYGARGVTDLAALLLARVRLIDNTTNGKDLVAMTRKDAAVVRFDNQEEPVNVSEEPYQVAAVDQIAPVLANALELDYCDGRSISQFLHTNMESSPRIHYTALVSVAGGMLSRVRSNAIEAAAKHSKG